jgi:ferric iron reductase protein FhuF
MSEEYEVLKAQKDELEKKMSNNPSCIDCVYYDTKKDVDLIVRRERARMRAIINDALRQTEKAIKTSKDPYFYGCRDTMNALLKVLKDGEADAGR